MAATGDRGVVIIALALLVVFGFTVTAAAGGPKKPAPKVSKTAKAKPAPKVPKTAKAKPAPEKPAPKKPEQPRKPKVGKQKHATQVQIRSRDVYFGRYRSFAKPAVLDTQKVFNAISYYQEVKSAGLTKKSGRYWILIQKSNKVFYKAMKRLAERNGFDLIGARDSIMIDGSNPVDVTDEIIKIVPTISIY